MANKTEGQEGMQGQSNVGGAQTGASIGSPISNEAYDVISALHEKLEGLEAYRKYAKDGLPQVWQQLTKLDVEAVGTLCTELERIVKEGKLRLQTPGKTH